VTAFSTAHRARCLTSDALCRSHPTGTGSRRTKDTPPGPTSTAGSSKTTVSPEPGRLPSTSAASSASACAGPPLRAQLALRRPRGTDSQTTWHRLPDVSTTKPASGTLSPPEHKTGWLDPGTSLASLRLAANKTWTRCRSSSSATRTAREHHRMIARSPAPSFDTAHPACAGLGETSEQG